MRVLHLINNLKREGAQMVVFNLLTATTANTIPIQNFVFARESGGSLQRALEESGIPVYVTDQYNGLLATSRSLQFIFRIIEKERIDVIHAHLGRRVLHDATQGPRGRYV